MGDVRRALAGAGVALAAYGATRSDVGRGLDAAAGAGMTAPRGRAVDIAVAAGTDLGSVYGLAGVATVVALRGHRRTAVDIVAAGSLAWMVAQGAKTLVGRPRPYQADGADRLVAEPAGTSFPSGHPAVAAAMAAAIVPVLPPAAAAVAGGLAVGVAASRLYVGVHYLTDVVAGLGIGVAAAATWRLLARRG